MQENTLPEPLDTVALTHLEIGVSAISSNKDGPDTGNDPSSRSVALPAITSDSYLAAAQYWHRYGLDVIPICPNTKRPAVGWDAWLKDLSAEKIHRYWTRQLDYEIGFIVGTKYIVCDADSPQSMAALAQVEKSLGVTTALTVQTHKGVHHYYRLATDTFAYSDSHCTVNYPDRIDIKAGRALVVLPPSTGKAIQSCVATHAGELTEVDQPFIDAIFVHNGRTPPRRSEVSIAQPRITAGINGQHMRLLSASVFAFDPDVGYDDWLRIGAVLFNETGGADEGLDLWNAWSRNGDKYRGSAELATKWRSFTPDHPRPVKLGTLIHMLAANGHDWRDIVRAAEEPFEVIAEKRGEAA